MDKRILVGIGLMIVGATTTTVALAADAGDRGTVTSWSNQGNGKKAIHVEQCTCTKATCQYTTCTRAALKETKDKICNEKKNGAHKFWVQIGEKPKLLENTARCKNGAAQ
jgi:hypothetical protein